MKKIRLVGMVLVAVLMCVNFTSCEKEVIGSTYSFEFYEGEIQYQVIISQTDLIVKVINSSKISYSANIKIPKNVTCKDKTYKVVEIGEGAFSGCTSLTSIFIPESVTEIGGLAFSGCTNLTSISIPESVTSIRGGAFENCRSLK